MSGYNVPSGVSSETVARMPQPAESAPPQTAVAPSSEQGYVSQPHGGAIRPGGRKGNKGGGRPKEAIRKRLRKVTNRSIEQLERRLAGDYSAENALRRFVTDKRLGMLTDEARALVEAVARECIPAGAPTLKELASVVDVGARYGVGTEDKVEHEGTQTRRYVVAFPRACERCGHVNGQQKRPAPGAGPIAVIEPPPPLALPAPRAPVDHESTAHRGTER